MLQARSVNKKALRLSSLSWTQEEIGGVIGVSQNRLSEDLSEMANLPKSIKTLLKSGLEYSDIAKMHNIPIQLVWYKQAATPGGNQDDMYAGVHEG